MSSPSSRQSYSTSTGIKLSYGFIYITLSGAGGVIVTDKVRNITTPTGLPWSVNINPTGVNPLKHTLNKLHGGHLNRDLSPPTSPVHVSKHDQVAILMGLLAKNSITIESLLSMSEDKQRETLMFVISNKNIHENEKLSTVISDKENNNDNSKFDLATAMKGIIAHTASIKKNNDNERNSAYSNSFTDNNITSKYPLHAPSTIPPATPMNNNSQPSTGLNSPFGSMPGIALNSGSINMMQPQQKSNIRSNMLNSIENKKLNTIMNFMGIDDSAPLPSKYPIGTLNAIGGVGPGIGPGGGYPLGLGGLGGFGSSAGSVDSRKLKDIPKYSKYFKMTKVIIMHIFFLKISYLFRLEYRNNLLRKRCFLKE